MLKVIFNNLPRNYYSKSILIMTLIKRMAIHNFAKTENSLAEGFTGYINSVITKL